MNKEEETKRIEAIVKSLDRGYISREAYRPLTQIEQDISRENAIYKVRQSINTEMKNKVPLTFVNLSQPTKFEPITKKPDITDNLIIMNMLESIGKGGQ